MISLHHMTEESFHEIDTEDVSAEQSASSMSAIETKLALAKKIITRMREELTHVERLLMDAESVDEADMVFSRLARDAARDAANAPIDDGRMIEGVFNGEHMVGSDGREYIVPPNYASKSKLVEGDIMKLTIQPNGTFLFKQIGPIERQRVMGELTRDETTNEWRVLAMGKKYNVLAAAVSYYKGSSGDDAVILIPKAAPSRSAAIENIVKRT